MNSHRLYQSHNLLESLGYLILYLFEHILLLKYNKNLPLLLILLQVLNRVLMQIFLRVSITYFLTRYVYQLLLIGAGAMRAAVSEVRKAKRDSVP